MSDATTPATEAATAETAPATTEAVTTDQLPEWGREKLTKANGEAAKYRTERNDALSALESARANETKLSEQLSETSGALAATNLELLKLKTALDSGVSSELAVEFAARLNGTDAESLAADAQKALKLYQPSNSRPAVTDPTPESRSSTMALNDFDGLENAINTALGI